MNAYRFDFSEQPPPPQRQTERRAADRPRFERGWNRAFRSKQSNASPGRIQIWVASPRSLLMSASCKKLLTQSDREELGLIVPSPSRDGATAARLLLRLALSDISRRALGAADWRFNRGQWTKPILSNFPNLQFNVSHCESLVVVAVSDRLGVGIDVESIDQIIDARVAQSFLSQCEQLHISKLKPSQRSRECLKLWTLKEALSKLLGTGGTDDFASIDFSLQPTRLRYSTAQASRSHAYFESIYLECPNDLCIASLAVGAQTPDALQGIIEVVSHIAPDTPGPVAV